MSDPSRYLTKSNAQDIVLATMRRWPLTMTRNNELSVTSADKLADEIYFKTLGTGHSLFLPALPRA